jgi:hypothetical protein
VLQKFKYLKLETHTGDNLSKNKHGIFAFTLVTLCVVFVIFSVFSQTVSARADPLSVQIQPSATEIPVNTEVQLFANVTGGLPDYLYRWYANNVSISENFTSATCTFSATEMGTYTIGCQVRDSLSEYASAPEIILTATANEPTLVGQAPSQPATASAENSSDLQNIALISAIVIVVSVIGAGAIIVTRKRKPKQS